MAHSDSAAPCLHIYFHDTSTADYWYWMYMALASHLSSLICPSNHYDYFLDAAPIVKEPSATPGQWDKKPRDDNVNEVTRQADFTTRKKSKKHKKAVNIHREPMPHAPVQLGNSFKGLDVTDADYDESDCSAIRGDDGSGTPETIMRDSQKGASSPYDEFDMHLLEHSFVTACQSDDDFMFDWSDLNNSVGHCAPSADKHDCDDGAASSSCRPVATQSPAARNNHGPHHDNSHVNYSEQCAEHFDSAVRKYAEQCAEHFDSAVRKYVRTKKDRIQKVTNNFDQLMAAVAGKDKLVAIEQENDQQFDDLVKRVKAMDFST